MVAIDAGRGEIADPAQRRERRQPVGAQPAQCRIAPGVVSPGVVSPGVGRDRDQQMRGAGQQRLDGRAIAEADVARLPGRAAGPVRRAENRHARPGRRPPAARRRPLHPSGKAPRDIAAADQQQADFGFGGQAGVGCNPGFVHFRNFWIFRLVWRSWCPESDDGTAAALPTIRKAPAKIDRYGGRRRISAGFVIFPVAQRRGLYYGSVKFRRIFNKYLLKLNKSTGMGSNEYFLLGDRAQPYGTAAAGLNWP